MILILMVQSYQQIHFTKYYSLNFLRYLLAEYCVTLPLVSSYFLTIAVAKLIKTAKPQSKSKFLRAMMNLNKNSNNILILILLLANWLYNLFNKSIFDGMDLWVMMLLLLLIIQCLSREKDLDLISQDIKVPKDAHIQRMSPINLFKL